MTTDTVRLPRIRDGVRPPAKARTIRLPAIRLPALTSVRQVVLTIGSLASGCVAAFDGLGRPAGFAAIALSGFVLNWLMNDDGGQQP